jgi:hypothetical protein
VEEMRLECMALDLHVPKGSFYKLSSVPRIAVVLQVPEPTHDGSKAWLVPSESLALILD